MADLSQDMQDQISALVSKQMGSTSVGSLVTQDAIPPGQIKPRHLVAGANPAGSLYYSDGTNFVKLSPGTSGQVLTLTNGVPTFATPGFQSGCSVYLSGSQSVTNGAFVKITFNTKAYDGLSEFDITNHKFVTTTAGRYLVTFNPVTSGITDTQSVLGAIYKNGVIAYSAALQSGSAGAGITAQVTAIMSLIAGDYIEFYVIQSDSGARDFGGGAAATVAMIQRLL